jgi:uncharacterized cupin superfamily protein
MTRPAPILNIADVPLDYELSHGEQFAAKVGRIAPKIGAKKLGYNVTVLPPGKRGFPFHNHHANEEMFFILKGTGVLRYGKDEFPVREGDVIACPPGGPEVAHQLVNTGSEELRYLAVSTTIDTDVFQYPDSGKVGMAGGRVYGTNPPQATFESKFYVEANTADYWDNEGPTSPSISKP